MEDAIEWLDAGWRNDSVGGLPPVFVSVLGGNPFKIHSSMHGMLSDSAMLRNPIGARPK